MLQALAVTCRCKLLATDVLFLRPATDRVIVALSGALADDRSCGNYHLDVRENDLCAR